MARLRARDEGETVALLRPSARDVSRNAGGRSLLPYPYYTIFLLKTQDEITSKN